MTYKKVTKRTKKKTKKMIVVSKKVLTFASF